ncbi:coniferyl-alcohol dehydrogenase [Paraburkholderia sp. MPAMCS5]|uniref:coniferyl-alcohol dehydrogenase n=1 Tax=Paraburkholderia sp. MPAMCS5 TaxID=3112563 RepID=UPI002E18AFFD|nr:coniferyl-alcohol dehydrogenase [Paraburkholderia sp. MPAMCS5]
MSLLDFSDQTIVVTGATSGIGRRTAQLLIENGANLIALDRDEPDFPVFRFVRADLSDPESIARAVGSLKSIVINGLANIAGVPGTLPDEVVWRVNYLGLKAITAGLVPQMPKGSSIVNLASMAGSAWRERAAALCELTSIDDWDEAEAWIKAHPEMSDQAYRKFKEAVVVWTLGTANALERRTGIRMNCVSPGPVQTPILEDFRKSMGEAHVADIIHRTGRAATPDDIAPVVLFLLSKASGWIVGADIPTEGGLTSSRFADTVKSYSDQNARSEV